MITLIPTTNQEAFDMTLRHLRSMTGPAMIMDTCAYRSETRDHTVLKCAIGNMIRDEDYDPTFEGVGINGLVDNHIVDPDGIDPRLLDLLQELHDNFEHWREDRFVAWEDALQIARDFGLDETEIHT